MCPLPVFNQLLDCVGGTLDDFSCGDAVHNSLVKPPDDSRHVDGGATAGITGETQLVTEKTRMYVWFNVASQRVQETERG